MVGPGRSALLAVPVLGQKTQEGGMVAVAAGVATEQPMAAVLPCADLTHALQLKLLRVSCCRAVEVGSSIRQRIC